MSRSIQSTRFRFWLWLIRVIGVIVPRRLRADWRQEWEAELRHREEMLAEWDRLNYSIARCRACDSAILSVIESRSRIAESQARHHLEF